MRACLGLIKPRISLLFAVTGLTAILVHGGLHSHPFRFFMIVLAIFLVGGALSSLLGLGTILFYSFFYTLWLKPRTPYNIVIGGIAGAMGPLIGWAAVAGRIDLIPFLMFLIIFFWTPPHFWALALYHQDDYKKVGLPMLPLIRGEEITRRHILLYSFTLIPLSASLYFVSDVLNTIYLLSALALGGLFIWFALGVYQKKTVQAYQRLFRYSIGYMTLLYLAIMVDTVF